MTTVLVLLAIASIILIVLLYVELKLELKETQIAIKLIQNNIISKNRSNFNNKSTINEDEVCSLYVDDGIYTRRDANGYVRLRVKGGKIIKTEYKA